MEAVLSTTGVRHYRREKASNFLMWIGLLGLDLLIVLIDVIYDTMRMVLVIASMISCRLDVRGILLSAKCKTMLMRYAKASALYIRAVWIGFLVHCSFRVLWQCYYVWWKWPPNELWLVYPKWTLGGFAPSSSQTLESTSFATLSTALELQRHDYIMATVSRELEVQLIVFQLGNNREKVYGCF